jgi:hypothetical protein
VLYHYTSAKLLEKIIASGKLRPSGEFGWRLLWASSSEEIIDPTFAHPYEDHIARFTLDIDDFVPWTKVRSRFRSAKLRRALAMEEVCRFKWGSRVVESWHVRAAALPASRWLHIETQNRTWRSYHTSESWRRIQEGDALADEYFRQRPKEDD